MANKSKDTKTTVLQFLGYVVVVIVAAGTLAGTNGRVSSMESRMNGIESDVNAIDARVDELNAGIDRIEGKVDATRDDIGQLSVEVESIADARDDIIRAIRRATR